MTVDKDGLSGNPATSNQDLQNPSLANAFDGVVNALQEKENRERIASAALKAKDETIRVAGEVGTNSLNVVKNLVSGEKADFWSVVNPITSMFNADKKKNEETKPEETKPGDTPPASTTPKPDDTKKDGEAAAPAKEGDHWLATIMFKFMPQGVKDWGATIAIPMVTHGQDLISKAKRPPKVVDDIGAYIDCLQGNNVTVIPKPVQDYALKLLETLGLGRNEDLATALSVGFISFIRTQIGNFLPSLGIKGFQDAATTMAPPSPAQLLGFAHNPETFLGLFRMAPGNSHIEDGLLQVFKSEFSKKHVIENIDSFFPASEKVTYSQFIKSYANLGQHMIAEGKWDSKNVDPALLESAEGILQKYNISDSRSLAYGLALASKEGADMIKNFTQPAAPAVVVENNAPKPPGA